MYLKVSPQVLYFYLNLGSNELCNDTIPVLTQCLMKPATDIKGSQDLKSNLTVKSQYTELLRKYNVQY